VRQAQLPCGCNFIAKEGPPRKCNRPATAPVSLVAWGKRRNPQKQ
jgi:hypothetical protein